jgi:rare lipoprotein A
MTEASDPKNRSLTPISGNRGLTPISGNRGLTPIFLWSRFCSFLAISGLFALAGCSSTPKPAASGGKFYQNDGPPKEVPASLLDTPDAVPRVEPFRPATLRPYTALGKSYTPTTTDAPLRERGLASWYGRQFHGARTATGEIYDMFAMTAAHPTMPLPSYARVTRIGTGASVIVRVNDRGPFHEGRIIDLSYVAAQKLGISATAMVEVERLTNEQIASGQWRRGTELAKAPSPTATPSVAGVPVPSVPVPVAPMTAVATAAVVAPLAAALPTPLPSLPAGAAPNPPQQPSIPTQAAPAGGWAVQLGAFAQAANAESLRDSLATALQRAGQELAPRIEHDGSVYRVLVGDAADRAAAAALAARLESLLARDVALYRRPQ